MPRKTKDQEIAKNEEKNIKISENEPKSKTTKTSKSSKSDNISKTKKVNKNVVTDTSSKSTSTKKSPTSKTSKAKKETSSKTSVSKKSATSRTSKSKKESASDLAKSKKSSTTKTSKTSKTKKASTKSATSKKQTSKKPKNPEVVEYYDLPYRYNQTVVKILAQTPTNLFIYWDISDEDRENYKKEYGENFFETTRPVLIVHNDTLNYSFEIEINDFANSWYLSVADSKCNYRIELGRRPNIKTEKLNKDYIYISSSNEIESPNDKILFDKTRSQKVIYFRNVKSGNTYTKQISDISFIKSVGKIYNIYDLYKAIYQNENIEEIYNLSNPSSGNPTSGR